MTRTITKKALAFSSAGLLAIGLAACSSDAPDDGATEGAGSTGPYHVVYTGGASLVTDWDVYIAEELGLYEKYNVEVETVKTETAEGATQLLVTGEAQIGRGLPPTIQAIAQSSGGVQLLDVADTVIRSPFFLTASPGIDSVSELVGKNVGTSSPTDSTTVVTVDLLIRLGVDPAAVNILAAGGTGARYAGLESGALDASLLLPPVNYQAEDGGFTTVGFVPDLAGDDYWFAFAGIIVNPTWAETNREALVAYLSARNEALEFLADPANRDEAIRILAEYTESDPEYAERTYDDLHIGTPESAFNSQIGIHLDAASGVLTGLQEADLAPADFSIEDVVDDSYAAEARG